MKKALKMAATLSIAGIVALSTACSNGDYNYTDDEVATFDNPNDALADLGISTGPALLTPDDLALMWSNMLNAEDTRVYVNGDVIDAATPFADAEAGTIMLPLVEIAQALGYTAVQEGDEVIIAPGTVVVAGVNSFARGREASVELTAAPVIIDGVLFVPWEFFHEILDAGAFTEYGNVHVNTAD